MWVVKAEMRPDKMVDREVGTVVAREEKIIIRRVVVVEVAGVRQISERVLLDSLIANLLRAVEGVLPRGGREPQQENQRQIISGLMGGKLVDKRLEVLAEH